MWTSSLCATALLVSLSGVAHAADTVRVTAQKTFTTLFPYPGIPTTANLNRQATVRLQ